MVATPIAVIIHIQATGSEAKVQRIQAIQQQDEELGPLCQRAREGQLKWEGVTLFQ